MLACVCGLSSAVLGFCYNHVTYLPVLYNHLCFTLKSSI